MGCAGSKKTADPSLQYAVTSDLVIEHDPFLLRIVSAHNMPSLDLLSASDVYAVASLMEGGVAVTSARWPVKPDAVNPYWDSCRSLGPASSSARVKISFFDHDSSVPFDFTHKRTASSPDFIGDIEVGVEDLPESGEPVELLLRTKHKARDPARPARCVISRAPPEAYTAPKKKTVYLIRHGESVWNEVRADHDPISNATTPVSNAKPALPGPGENKPQYSL